MLKSKSAFALPFLFAIVAAPLTGVVAANADLHQQISALVDQVRTADYAGDQAEMKRAFDGLALFADDGEFGARVHYWRGFAMWRCAINGFNDKVDRAVLEQDLDDALVEFNKIGKSNPVYVEARIAIVSCTGYIMFIHSGEPKAQELLGQLAPVAREVKEIAPDNPRWLWVSGPIFWSTPEERGGGQNKAFAAYEKGLEAIRKQPKSTDPLDVTWGEPELFMNRAWSHLNKKAPDFAAAERDAKAALALVPTWHYVRDILIPQIQTARSEATPRR